MQASGAVMALIFYVVVLGYGWKQSFASSHLVHATQNDFGPALIEFDRPVDLDVVASEAAHVSNVLQIVRKNDHSERASHLFFAEIEKMNAS